MSGEDVVVEQKLAQYLMSGVLVSGGQNEIWILTDKAVVCTLPLQNTCFVYMSNDCVIAAPQVGGDKKGTSV